MPTTNTRISAAIARSIEHNEIVTIWGCQADRNTLRSICDDCADHPGTEDSHPLVEAWGEHEGKEWRVHMYVNCL